MEPGAGRARFDGGCSLREDAEGTCSSRNNAGTEETIMKAIALVASAALVCLAPAVRAADYPAKPITMMIGFAPGGPSDVMARILTRKMEEILKQPLVIENRAGAGGGIAGAAVALVRGERARRRTATPCCSPPAACSRSM
jgi:tripartite-type tricarboxylate transporter receptor subunit TctC